MVSYSLQSNCLEVFTALFAIFPYIVDGQVYVEAYPLDERDTTLVLERAPLNYLLVFYPSRNQARKAAYCMWVRSDGKGFNRFPLSPFHKKVQKKSDLEV